MGCDPPTAVRGFYGVRSPHCREGLLWGRHMPRGKFFNARSSRADCPPGGLVKMGYLRGGWGCPRCPSRHDPPPRAWPPMFSRWVRPWHAACIGFLALREVEPARRPGWLADLRHVARVWRHEVPPLVPIDEGRQKGAAGFPRAAGRAWRVGQSAIAPTKLVVIASNTGATWSHSRSSDWQRIR